VLDECLEFFGSELFAVDDWFSTTPDGAMEHFDGCICITLFEGPSKVSGCGIVNGNDDDEDESNYPRLQAWPMANLYVVL